MDDEHDFLEISDPVVLEKLRKLAKLIGVTEEEALEIAVKNEFALMRAEPTLVTDRRPD